VRVIYHVGAFVYGDLRIVELVGEMGMVSDWCLPHRRVVLMMCCEIGMG
jgi:hypothetical protein